MQGSDSSNYSSRQALLLDLHFHFARRSERTYVTASWTRFVDVPPRDLYTTRT